MKTLKIKNKNNSVFSKKKHNFHQFHKKVDNDDVKVKMGISLGPAGQNTYNANFSCKTGEFSTHRILNED